MSRLLISINGSRNVRENFPLLIPEINMEKDGVSSKKVLAGKVNF